MKKVVLAQIPLILALLAAPLLVSATEVEEYFPIRVGASWTYQVLRERSTTVAEKAVEERITGWSVERVVKPSDEISYAVPVYTLSQEISEENHTTGRKSVVSIESHVFAEPHPLAGGARGHRDRLGGPGAWSGDGQSGKYHKLERVPSGA
jgi:hypothetical protein